MSWSPRKQQILDRMAVDQIVVALEITSEQTETEIYKLGQNYQALAKAVNKTFAQNKEKN